MTNVDDKVFEAMVSAAIDAIPPKYADHMQNVGFVIEDQPSPQQRERLHLFHGQTLYGLYEGIPLTRRGSNYSGVLPDKITIFKGPIMMLASSREQLEASVKDTVWHEVAHHFGLDHGRIHELQNRSRQTEQ